jgi:hypothetical protein
MTSLFFRMLSLLLFASPAVPPGKYISIKNYSNISHHPTTPTHSDPTTHTCRKVFPNSRITKRTDLVRRVIDVQAVTGLLLPRLERQKVKLLL